MIDVGLLLSVIAALGVPALVARRRPMRTIGGRSFLDVTLSAVGVGVLVGRLSALALDDPGGLKRLSDVLVIRSGMEFWPGVAAAAVWIVVAARREGCRPLARLADLAPFALWGYAAYEATCLVRDGCFGPVSPIGLRPEGLSVTMVPVGIVVAIAVSAVAYGLLSPLTDGRDVVVVVAAIGVVATTRATGSFWLPALGSGLTRQHRMSIVVAAIALSGLAALWTRSWRGSPEASPTSGAS